MKNIIIVLVSFLLWSCASDTTPSNGSTHTEKVVASAQDSARFHCKQKVDSLGLGIAYDTCRFLLYCYGSDRKIYFKDKHGYDDSSALFSQLNLDCGSINILNDTIEFIFHIELEESLEIDWRRAPVANGVLYKLSENRPIGFIYNGPARYLWSSNPKSPENNPLQPETIKYIQANYSRFNPWFVERLKERKIVK